MMTKDEVWDVVAKFEKELRRKLRSYEASGVDLHAMYMDVAEGIVEGRLAELGKLEKDRLPGLLWYHTRYACLDRLRSYEMAKRAAWANNESVDGCGDGDAEAYCVWRPASGAQERVEEWDDRPLDMVMRLRRIPAELANTYALYHAAGHTLQELAEKLSVSVWEIRRRLDAADAALQQIDRDEAEGNLQPRAQHETPRHKARREAAERSCAQLRRPTAGKPRAHQGKKLDPRTWWYSTVTIKWFEWIEELAARIKRGERVPYAKPILKYGPAAMMERPLSSLDHKLYDLILFVERTKDEQDNEQTLPLAA
jgi:hypothetical protein